MARTYDGESFRILVAVDEHTRECLAIIVARKLNRIGTTALFTEPGNPLENGFCENFHGKLRFDLLDGEIFYNLKKAKILIEKCRKEYYGIRPHSILGERPPAPESMAWVPPEAMLPASPVVSEAISH